MTFQALQLRSVITRGIVCVLLVSTALLPTTFGFVARIPLLFSSAVTSSSSSLSSSSSSSVLGTTLAGAVKSSTNQKDGAPSASNTGDGEEDTEDSLLEDFVEFLQTKQTEIIQQLEDVEATQSGATFSRDPWGLFAEEDKKDTGNNAGNSGGITRVIQGGSVVEKGACSLTVIRDGILTADRAATIRSRHQTSPIQAGDKYSAVALSMVLHSSNPMVPTFRSDVRVFLVQSSPAGGDGGGGGDGDDSSNKGETLAWFGGGADLTPYYLFEDDVGFFHGLYRDLCDSHLSDLLDDDDSSSLFSYASMKKACDDYFYLPARAEHRGTGGIFFDDMPVTPGSTAFVQGVADTWMPSWLPIVEQRQSLTYSDQQKQWQLLRRGRYLEFNLLYDRGVKFGLANANPRVEGVMVSAPPMIAFEYNHKIEEDSPEAALTRVLKEPREWV
jgi:coproporphyrinogen III oxidase